MQPSRECLPNGVVEPDRNEECDPEQKGSLLCNYKCQIVEDADCGNGRIDPGEQCDPNTEASGSDCTENCTWPLATPPALCGDGVQEKDEICDEGTLNGEYGYCNSDCSGTRTCGDGVKDPEELCDDDSANDKDACSDDCVPARWVFLTSKTFTGELTSNLSSNGVLLADSYCRELALAANLGTPLDNWTAWLSDANSSPSTRMDTSFRGWYRLPNADGEPIAIAKGWEDLTDGSIEAPINRTETGEIASEPTAWTSTNAQGKLEGSNHCNNWSVGLLQVKGIAGDPNATDSTWTVMNKNPFGCSGGGNLYCFQN